MKTYLIYKHTSPDGKAFIGITINPESVNWKPQSNNRALYEAVEKYGWDSFTHEILLQDLNTTKHEANTIRSKLVKEYNTLSPFGYNLLTRGDNSQCAEETRNLYSESAKENLLNPEIREKVLAGIINPSDEQIERRVAGLRKALKTPEVRAKRSENLKAAYADPEFKARISAAQQATNAKPEIKEKRIAAIKKSHARPEVKAKISATSKAARANPEVNAKLLAALKVANARPEVKAKRSASVKAAFARPEVKEKHSAAMKVVNANPEVKAKIAAANASPEVKAKRSVSAKAVHAKRKAEKEAMALKIETDNGIKSQ